MSWDRSKCLSVLADEVGSRETATRVRNERGCEDAGKNALLILDSAGEVTADVRDEAPRVRLVA
jgi:hypothetical protein